MKFHRNPSTGKISRCRATIRCRYESTSVDNSSAEVVDSDGSIVPVTPGVIDNQAKYVYTRGQCLALAEEIALATGWGVRVVSEQKKYGFDDEPYRFPLHIYAESETGELWDVEGKHTLEEVTTKWTDSATEVVHSTYSFEDVQSGRLYDEVSHALEDQDYGTARTFVESVLSSE